VQERSVQIDSIEVTPTSLAQQDHPALPQISDDAPDGPLCEPQVSRDLVDRRVGTGGDVEKDPTLDRKQGPAGNARTVRVGRQNARPPALLLFRLFPYGLLDSHGKPQRMRTKVTRCYQHSRKGLTRALRNSKTRSSGASGKRKGAPALLPIDGGAAMRLDGSSLGLNVMVGA